MPSAGEQCSTVSTLSMNFGNGSQQLEHCGICRPERGPRCKCESGQQPICRPKAVVSGEIVDQCPYQHCRDEDPPDCRQAGCRN